MFMADSFVPAITKPTRVTINAATLTGNIFLKYNPQTTFNAGSIMTNISDYYVIFFYESSHKTMDASKMVECSNFSDSSVDN